MLTRQRSQQALAPNIKIFSEASTSGQLADADITLAVRWITHQKTRPIGNNNCSSLVNIVFNDRYQ